MFPNIFLIIILLFLSFIFSGTETAFFSLSPMEINAIKKKNSIIDIFNKNRTGLLITLLFMNTFVNVFFVTIFSDIFNNYVINNDFIAVLIMTFLLLIFGEITPKILAIYKKELFVKNLPFIYIFYIVLMPLNKILTPLLTIISKKKNNEYKKEEFEEILELLKQSDKNLSGEVDLIKKFLKLKTLKAIDIAIKKKDIVFIQKNTSTKKVFEIFQKTRFSRIPVIDENNENIIGVVYFKDMILIEEASSIKSIIRPINSHFYHINVIKLLSIFLKQKEHIGVLINKENRMVGLLTLNNIIEILLGDLPDEKGNINE